MKFCKDCKYDKNFLSSHWCQHISLYRGVLHSNDYIAKSCIDMRSIKGACGPEGSLFAARFIEVEPKPVERKVTTWQRVKQLMKTS